MQISNEIAVDVAMEKKQGLISRNAYDIVRYMFMTLSFPHTQGNNDQYNKL